MKALPIVKTVSTGIISAGVGTVVSSVIKFNTPEGLKLPSKILMGVGTAFIGATISTVSSKAANEMFDSVMVAFRSTKTTEESTSTEVV